MRWPANEKIVSAILLLCGAMLCVLPWLQRRAALGAPAVFDDQTAVYQQSLAAVDAVDAAFRTGDGALLRVLATGEFLTALEARLRWLGQRLEGGPAPIGIAGSLGEELRGRPFRGGRARGDVVVLGFDLGCREADAGYPVVHGIKLVILEWNGQRLLLHAMKEHVQAAAADLDAAFARLCASWLPAG